MYYFNLGTIKVFRHPDFDLFWPTHPPYHQTSSFSIPTLKMTSSFPHTHPPIDIFFSLSLINKAKIRQGLFLLKKKTTRCIIIPVHFSRKKKSVTWIKLISDILERINRFQVKIFFWSRHHLATPTHPPCHQTSSFGQPTHLFDDVILEWSLRKYVLRPFNVLKNI